MRRRFRYLPHTADIAFVAYGRTFGEAMGNAAAAMFGIMFDMRKLGRLDAKRGVKVLRESANSKEDLVWFTLQGILSEIQMRSLSPVSFSVGAVEEKKGKFSIKGNLTYKRVSPEAYGLLEVKAVTPSDLQVKQGKNGIAIRVVVDI